MSKAIKSRRLVLVTVDSLRYDALNREDMPFLSLLARKGNNLPNYYVNAPFTPASFPSLFTSRLPLHVISLLPIKREESFVHILNKHGFYTIGITNNPFLSEYYNFNSGFEEYQNLVISKLKQDFLAKRGRLRSWVKNSRWYKEVRPLNVWLHKQHDRYLPMLQTPYYRGEIVTRLGVEAINRLRQRYDKWFLWMHYMDTHYPYYPPRQYRRIYGCDDWPWKLRKLMAYAHTYGNNREELSRMSQTELTKLKLLYRASVRYVDDQIRRVYESFGGDDRGLMLVVTADHGEEFMEHGELGHLAKMYNELLHVPMVIYPDNRAVRNNGRLLRQGLDLAPSILDAGGIKPPDTMLGKSVFLSSGHSKVIAECVAQKNGLPTFIDIMAMDGRQSQERVYSLACFNHREKIIWPDKIVNKFEKYYLSGDMGETDEKNWDEGRSELVPVVKRRIVEINKKLRKVNRSYGEES